MTELVMLWLARSCLFAVQVKDCSLKNNRKQNIHTLSAGRHTHAHHVFAPHAESDFNCFVSVVPSEWERSLGLQFTRHICRCCISNWETQAVRKNTDTDTQREKYTDRLSLSLSLTCLQCRCSTARCFPQRRQNLKMLAHLSVWARWNVSASFYKSVLTFMWDNAKINDKTKLRHRLLSAGMSNQEKECAHQ